MHCHYGIYGYSPSLMVSRTTYEGKVLSYRYGLVIEQASSANAQECGEGASKVKEACGSIENIPPTTKSASSTSLPNKRPSPTSSAYSHIMDSQSAPASVGTCNRSGSPALSEMSELSVLSRTPSPPPESSQAHAITDCKPTQGPMRDSCGRYLPRKKKRAASPSNGYVASIAFGKSNANTVKAPEKAQRPDAYKVTHTRC